MEDQRIQFSNLSSNRIIKSELPKINQVVITNLGKDTYGWKNFYEFRLWPKKVFKIKIDLEFDNIPDKECIVVKELNFIENQNSTEKIVEIVPYYYIKTRKDNDKTDYKKITINGEYKYGPKFGNSTITFNIGDFTQSFNVNQPK